MMIIMSAPPTRRTIRFAPLPDPRRAVLVAENGVEVPLADDTHIPAATSLLLITPELFEPHSSSSSSSSTHSLSSTPRTATPSDFDKTSPPSSAGSSPISPSSALPAKSAPQTTRPLSFIRALKRFGRSSDSSDSLTPTPSLEQKRGRNGDDSYALFRSSSRESTDTATGWSLTRWTSAGSAVSSRAAPYYNGGSPLARSQSSQSYKSKSKSFFSGSTSSISSSSDSKRSKPKIAPGPNRAAANRHKGTRMLNGRVYGAPKRNPNANPFANARDEEPEFVEWGYGGMGSVKGAAHAGVDQRTSAVNWDRLHGGSSVKQGVGGDEDDGSGIAWIKKRREERERRAREEKEAAERKVAEEAAAASESQNATPTPTRSSTMTDSFTESTDESPVSPSDFVEEPLPLLSPAVDPHHVLQAITVPMKQYRHHRGRSSSFISSTGLTLAIDPSTDVPSVERTPTPPPMKRVSIESRSSSEDDESSDDEDERDSEDSEDEDEAELRKTTLCRGAGVEKISRHKE